MSRNRQKLEHIEVIRYAGHISVGFFSLPIKNDQDALTHLLIQLYIPVSLTVLLQVASLDKKKSLSNVNRHKPTKQIVTNKHWYIPFFIIAVTKNSSASLKGQTGPINLGIFLLLIFCYLPFLKLPVQLNWTLIVIRETRSNAR